MSYAEALRVAVQAAESAGATLRDELHHPGGPRGGHGHAPADEDAERAIRKRLTDAFPAWGFRGEETGSREPGAGQKPVHLWLVDPNDGTRDFLRGLRGSAVSIGLLRDGLPVLGVVYAFSAPDDDGDLFAWAEGCRPLRRNGRPVARADWPTAMRSDSVLLASQTADVSALANARCVAPGRFRNSPSIAYRLAQVAAGDGDVCASLSGPGAWDYAAGHALLRGVGGILLDEEGRPVVYSETGESQTRSCFGGAPKLADEMWRRPWQDVFVPAQPADAGYPPELDLIRPERGRLVRDAGLLRRAQGCLLGQLAGDALGSLVEFRSPRQIERAHPHGVRRLVDGGVWNTLAGQPTDDSELALMLARSIVARGGYDREAAARAYAYWYRSGPFDVGSTTRRALDAVTDGDVARGAAAEAMAAAANPSSQANGSLMRISPLGIWGHGLPSDQLADDARADSALTHPNAVCQEACAAFTVAVATAIATGMDAEGVYRRTLEWAESARRERTVLQSLRDAAVSPPADYLSQQGWVLIALQNAFYQLLHAPSLEEGVVRTVAAGGDTDTNAAIAGALLGAVHGREAVPAQWRLMLLSCRPLAEMPNVHVPRPRPFWPVDALELAERLLC